MAQYDPELREFSTRKMNHPSHVLFVDIWMPTADKYYLDTKDGRTTTHNQEIVAKYESKYREDLLRTINYMIKTHNSIKNLSFVQNDEVTPNVLTRILEAMPTVDYVSLIQCRQFSYDTIHCFEVSDSAPELYLECTFSHNFNAGALYNANWVALLWVYLQRYRSRMTGETLERDEDTDSDAEAYGNAYASDAPLRPWQEQNYTIGVGSSAESLLDNQIKTNHRFLRDLAELLLPTAKEGPSMVRDYITGEREHWDLARLLNNRIGSGKALDRQSKFGRNHYCSDCSQRLQGLSFARNQLHKKRDDDPTCAACQAEKFGEPPFHMSDWKLRGPIKWKVFEPLETHFNEMCPINLMGDKCKCPLPKVDRKDPSLYNEKPWLQLLQGLSFAAVATQVKSAYNGQTS